jgi:hypothetical protein
MPFPQMLEVALGLCLIYYILGAFVSLITQMVMDSLEARGKALQDYLEIMVGDLAAALTSLPQIRALEPIRFARWWNVLGARTEAKKIDRIPVESLVDGFFDLAGLASQSDLRADELARLIDRLPESEGKQALLGWISQGILSIKDLRSRMRAYFAGMLDQAAQLFRAKARSFVILASILVTALLGTDTIQLAQQLWTNAGLRSGGPEQVASVAGQPQAAVESPTLLTDLGTLAFQPEWWKALLPPAGAWSAEWVGDVLMKLAGLAITAWAVSQGSSFWYDLLKKLMAPAARAKSRQDSPLAAVEARGLERI